MIHHIQSAALPALNCPKEKNKNKKNPTQTVECECWMFLLKNTKKTKTKNLYILWLKVNRTKLQLNKTSDNIIPSLSFICITPTIFTKGYFARSAHIALSVIKMNCWCAWVQFHKCAKSDTTMPISKRMPSLRRMFLSLMHFPRVQSWQRSATLNWRQAWHVSKHHGMSVQKLTGCREERDYTRTK